MNIEIKNISENEYLSLVDFRIEEAINQLHDCPHLYEIAKYHFHNKGSRLMPKVGLQISKIFNTDLYISVSLATCIELFHNFTLIHDDIIDEDELRRNRISSWKEFGIPLALVAGNSIKSLSYSLMSEVFNNTSLSQLKIKRAIHYYINYTHTVYEGECLDIIFENQNNISIDEYINMIQKKSGSTLGCICFLIAYMSTDKVELHKLCEDLGVTIGTCLQIINDLNSYVKSNNLCSDFTKRKKTLPLIYFLNKIPDLFEDSKIYEMINIKQKMETFGVFEKVRKKAIEYQEKAIEILHDIKNNLNEDVTEFSYEITNNFHL
ncbi:MAG: polyprenyl synthetase family protein [Bacteroidales bacterium]|jgi:geranylgeranyl pyrophosphate synthase|nr:polyprenyl synthetase family protein [Bacteroidales bacterium]